MFEFENEVCFSVFGIRGICSLCISTLVIPALSHKISKITAESKLYDRK